LWWHFDVGKYDVRVVFSEALLLHWVEQFQRQLHSMPCCGFFGQ